MILDIIDYIENINSNTNNTSSKSHLRNFVLFPLKEISPNGFTPLLNKRIDFLIKKLNFKLRNEITRIKESVIIE